MSWTQGSPLPPNIVPFLSPDEYLQGVNAAGTVVGGAAGAAMQAAGDLTAAQLHAIMPAARAANISKYLGPINTAFRRYGLTAPEQRAAILGQISVECGQLNAVVENLNYSAKRLHVVSLDGSKPLKRQSRMHMIRKSWQIMFMATVCAT